MKMAENDEMDGLYSGGEDKVAPPASIDQEEQEQMQETALVPVKLLDPHDGKGIKVGDEIMVKVTALHGDEAEIAYASGKSGEGDEGEEGKKDGDEMSSDDEIDSLDNY